MSITDSSSFTSAYESVVNHPYAANSGLETVAGLADDYNFGEMVEFYEDIMTDEMIEPFDLIVGDDVSGRIPTLIMHRFLREARASGHLDEVPATVFMASGSTGSIIQEEARNLETDWVEKLQDHAGKVLGRVAAKKVLILTEVVFSGRSIERLKSAFNAHGVYAQPCVTPRIQALYLGRGSCARDRQLVGVEKHPPQATTRRIPFFDSRESAKLRHFLNDYAVAIHGAIFGSEE